MTLRERISKFVEVLIEKLNLLQQSIPNASYSNVEQLTGGKWINGKRIYRIVFQRNSSGSSSPTTINLSSLDIEDIVDLSGSAKLVRGAQTATYIVNSVRALHGNRITTEAYRVKTATQDVIRIGMSTHLDPPSGGGVVTFTYEVAPFTIILEYTKVSDIIPDPDPEPTSNRWLDTRRWLDTLRWKE